MKKGFFEMECVSLKEIWEFENELHKADCQFVSKKSMMTDTIAEVYAIYGEVANEDLADCVEQESMHGYDELKDLYEQVFE